MIFEFMAKYIAISDILSLLALIFSIYVFFKNQLYTNYIATIDIEQNIFKIKSSLTETEANYKVFSSHKEDPLYKVYKTSYEEQIIALISAFETFSEMYYKRQIVRSLFKRKYKYEIKNLFKNELYSKFISDEYTYLIKFHSSLK